MAMAEHGTIDIVVRDPKTGKLLLVMTEDRPWDDSAMLDEFLTKLGTYISYAVSDQFRIDHPDFKSTDVVIKLDCAHSPNDPMKECFADVPSKLRDFGIGFEYEVFEDEPDDNDEVSSAKTWWKFW